MIPVQGCVKNYHWGKVGSDSYIARFQAEVTSGSKNDLATDEADPKKPLAELWFGSHPAGPSLVVVDNQRVRLDTFLAKEPAMVASIELYHKYDKKLPFLFKILSVDQPLSLQAHPDKKLARILHEKDPQNYPDANHKPELAIALTNFEVLCDFRPTSEILHFMKVLGPLQRIVGKQNFENYLKFSQHDGEQHHQRTALGDCFKSLMTCGKEVIQKETQNLLYESASLIGKDLFVLIEHLNKLYPGDPGTFAPFFLNYIKLNPGQAIFLKANKLHAYLKGECVECMACSDNVVRAGLTTKFRDVQTLLEMLNYETVKNHSDVLFAGIQSGREQSITTFAPTEDFKVDKIVITQKLAPTGEFTLTSLSSASFLLVFGGKVSITNFFDSKLEHKLATGSAAFIPPKVAVRLHKIQAPLTIYRAYC